jgi:hypothetical protein
MTPASSTAAEETLHFVTGTQKRAAYRPAALRTNSSSRLSQHATGMTSADKQSGTHGERRAVQDLHPSGVIPRQGDREGGRRDRSGTVASTASTATFHPGQGITRLHWQPDASTAACTACAKPFTFLERKHHCRKCGHIFCSAHSRYTILLSPDATFVKPGGTPSEGQTGRACPRCRRDFELFLRPPTLRRPSGSGAPGQHGIAMAKKPDEEDTRGLPAQSVPTDWTWSTF